MKRTIRNPQYFLGKIIDTTKWILPSDYATCEYTGKLYHVDQLCNTFSHTMYDKQVLIELSIYIEDANWLSDEGYDAIMGVLINNGVPTPLEIEDERLHSGHYN